MLRRSPAIPLDISLTMLRFGEARMSMSVRGNRGGLRDAPFLFGHSLGVASNQPKAPAAQRAGLAHALRRLPGPKRA